MIVNYIRVSTLEQNTARQETKGLTYIDKCSGSIPFAERKEAKKLLKNEAVTEIHVHSIDRLGRNTLDIMQTIQNFTNKGINVVSRKEGLQTLVNGEENPIAKMMIGILGTLAEFELTRSKERQAEGIAKGRARGSYKGNGGNKKTETVTEFMNKKTSKAIARYLKQGNSLRASAKLSGTSLGTVQKVNKLLNA